MPAGIGRKYVGDMFAAIGGLTRQGRAENALGMGGAFAAQRRKNLIKYGVRLWNGGHWSYFYDVYK
jgi:hypothetical protein